MILRQKKAIFIHPDVRTDALNQPAVELCDRMKRQPDKIVDTVLVGNTAINHIFAGMPVRTARTLSLCPGDLIIEVLDAQPVTKGVKSLILTFRNTKYHLSRIKIWPPITAQSLYWGALVA